MSQIHPWVAERRLRVRFGIAGGPRDDWPAARDYVQRAEGLGFDAFWRSDHPTSQMDCWTSLAALTEATDIIRLGSLVPISTLLWPVTLAESPWPRGECRPPTEADDGHLGGAGMIASPQESIERIRSLRAAGFGYFILSVPAYDEETVDLLAGTVIPSIEGALRPMTARKAGEQPACQRLGK